MTDDVLEDGSNPTYGTELTARQGVFYEGCGNPQPAPVPYAPGKRAYACDYQTREYVSRQHYSSSGWVLNVFWRWANYTGNQAECALAFSGLWGGIKGKTTFLVLLHDCKNGPLKDQNGPPSQPVPGPGGR